MVASNSRKSILGKSSSIICFFALAVLAFATGCASKREERALQKLIREPVLPPSFLSGPAGLLLTNSSSYSAHLELDVPNSPTKDHFITGQLLERDGQLVFAPAGQDKTFVWTVANHSGWVFSEALQGYAPASISTQFTNVTTVRQESMSERINGHPTQVSEVNVSADNGTSARFEIWRATDLAGIPVRIKFLSVAGAPVLNLLDVRTETLPPKLFAPPDGFTAYSNPEAMISELIMRKSKLRTTDTEKLGAPLPVPNTRPGY